MSCVKMLLTQRNSPPERTITTASTPMMNVRDLPICLPYRPGRPGPLCVDGRVAVDKLQVESHRRDEPTLFGVFQLEVVAANEHARIAIVVAAAIVIRDAVTEDLGRGVFDVDDDVADLVVNVLNRGQGRPPALDNLPRCAHARGTAANRAHVELHLRRKHALDGTPVFLIGGQKQLVDNGNDDLALE